MDLFVYIVCAVALISVLIRLATAHERYVLAWSDEFDGEQGSAPDTSKWNYDLGGSGFGNHELECYTDRRENSFLDGTGNLVIKAIKETYAGADGIKRDYTSARLLTKGKFAQRYGRFEARIKLPVGKGIWSAFWMMGDNIDTVGWPDCGEIDNEENIGSEPGINNGSLHGPGYSGANSLSAKYALPDGKRLCDNFHVYTIEWEPEAIRFYVDGNLYETRTAADVPGKKWVFDHPFFILLDLAIGGDWPGSPDETTIFPQTMLVDYVRVYADMRYESDVPSPWSTPPM